MRRGVCGRRALARVYPAADMGLSVAVPQLATRCIMHVDDPRKDADAFQRELITMWTRRDFDHTRFVFPSGSAAQDVLFEGEAIFEQAIFWGVAKFKACQFVSRADFDHAWFVNGADFSGCHFNGSVSFVNVSFGVRHEQELSEYQTVAIADFSDVMFAKPEEVTFRRTNQATSEGLRLRAMGCNIEQLHFEHVKWHRYRGRLVLQDEMDLLTWSRIRNDDQGSYYVRNMILKARYGSFERRPTDVHGLIAVAYARLIMSFDQRHNYDNAEDAFCGMMEMKRLDPTTLPWARYFADLYAKVPMLAALMRVSTLLFWYRVVSYYGSRYTRAMIVLLLILLGFASAFALSNDLTVGTGEERHVPRGMSAFAAGCVATLEVATFQRDRVVNIDGAVGSTLRLAESIVVPSQVAIFLLALRRRFKR